MQSVQNAVARSVTPTGRREHISPVLLDDDDDDYTWLPVGRRVDFKLATLMFNTMQGCAPSYLSDASQLVPDARRRLRSSHRHTSDLNLSVRQDVWCRQTAAVEQLASFAVFNWQLFTVQQTAEDIICSLEIEQSDQWLLLLGAGYKWSYLLTYLLTYLLR